MSSAKNCSDRDQLRALLLGELSEQESAAISEHLAECPSCQAITESLTASDLLIDIMRESARQPAPALTAEVERIITQLRDRSAAEIASSQQMVMSEDSDPDAQRKANSNFNDDVTRELSGTWRPSQAADEIGRMGDYRILRLLGSGGMGVVFLAEDTSLRRKVALKMMRPRAAENPGATERFLREARAAAAVRHNHIITVYQVGEEAGVPFLAMEFLEGESLDDRLKRQPPLPIADTLRIGREIAEALAAAHAKGLLHRDVKPANVWLEENWKLEDEQNSSHHRVKLLDFGLARSVKEDSNLTSSGMIIGTPSYMAPEQASGELVDGRADLFALGVILYRMTTNQLPFPGKNPMEVLKSLITLTPTAPNSLNPNVPKALSDLIERLMAKAAKDRPEAAVQVARQLAQIERASLRIDTSVNPVLSNGSETQKRTVSARKNLAWIGGGLLSMALLAGIVANLPTQDRMPVPLNGELIAEARKPLAFEMPGFDDWVKEVATKAPKQEVDAVAKKLQELNPGFDGTVTPTIESNVVTGMKFVTDRVADISPVRALVGLRTLECSGSVHSLGEPGNGILSDLSPLKGMGLKVLTCGSNRSLSDLTPVAEMPLNVLSIPFTSVADLKPLQGMKLTNLDIGWTRVADLSPLKGMPLTTLGCAATKVTDLFALQGMKLTKFCCNHNHLTDLTPLKGMPLTELELRYSHVSDLTPVQGMPLNLLWIDHSGVSDLSPLRGMKLSDIQLSPSNVTKGMHVIRQMDAIKTIGFAEMRWPAEEFWKKYDAGEFGKPAAQFWKDVEEQRKEKPLAFQMPGFDRWIKEVQAMPAEKQIDAVSRKLIELNPKFDGKLKGPFFEDTPNITNGVVTGIGFSTDHVVDISPIQALKELDALNCGSYSSDKYSNKLFDLSPLRGMKLGYLACAQNRLVADLSPLKGMPLHHLYCNGSQFANLAPLAGMPLETLNCYRTAVSDLKPLENCKDLKTLVVSQTKVTATTVASLKAALPACKIEWDDPTKLRKPAFNEPAFQQWVKAVQGMPAERQLEAVSKKLTELNPGFDGKLNGIGDIPPVIENGVITAIGFFTDEVDDISPIRAFSGLKQLDCNSKRKGKLANLSPLQGLALSLLNLVGNPVADLLPLKDMPLEHLNVGNTHVSDLSPLKSMPLKFISCWGTNVSDLSPLQGAKLTGLSCGVTPVFDLSPLKGMPLQNLGIERTAVSDLSSLIGMNLVDLECSHLDVADLSPLKGMPLRRLYCNDTEVTDLSPISGMNLEQFTFTPRTVTSGMDIIRRMASLKVIAVEWAPGEPFDTKKHSPEEFWKKYEAGEFGKPTANRRLAFELPSFDQWVKSVAAMPAEKQIEAVSRKLMELNPGFDGKVTHEVVLGEVTTFNFKSDRITDISPVRVFAKLRFLDCSGSPSGSGILGDLSPIQGMRLTFLNCSATNVSDLSPLRGMPLTFLSCSKTNVSDLSPLKGMPLSQVYCYLTQVSDLSPLKDSPLQELNCGLTKVSELSPLIGMSLRLLVCRGTQVADLSPLYEMPLTKLECDSTPVSDLSPLWGMNLKTLSITPNETTKGIDVIRQMNSLEIIAINVELQFTPAEFWKKYDAGEFGKATSPSKPITDFNSPAFLQWLKEVRAMPVAKQVEAVSKKLMELNPGFDGKLTAFDGTQSPAIENGVVTNLKFFTDNVTNIMPLKVFAGLKRLNCSGSTWRAGKLADLSPLKGMLLTDLTCSNTQVSDLSPLAGMPLRWLSVAMTPVGELAPLNGMPLAILNVIETQVTELSPSKGMPLDTLAISGPLVTDLSPLKSVPIKTLVFRPSYNTDLTTLKDLPLQHLEFDFRPGLETDLFRSIKTLETVNGKPAAEFCREVDAYNAAAKRPLAFQTPGFDNWVKHVAVLPVEEQLKTVSKKLQELNSDFDGKMTPTIESGVVTGLQMFTDDVVDISPLRGFRELKVLDCSFTAYDKGYEVRGLSNLAPLQGMPLTELVFRYTNVTDLSPLKGMKLTKLYCHAAHVSDLSPLENMPLTWLAISNNPVKDLSPLKGMPLKVLWMGSTLVTDLSPLAGMTLVDFAVDQGKATDISLLKDMPLKYLRLSFKPERDTEVVRSIKTLETINHKPAAEFWKEVEEQKKAEGSGEHPLAEAKKPLAFETPGFEKWVKDAQALSAEKQIEAVSKKLMELNPRFDGKLEGMETGTAPQIVNGAVQTLAFCTDDVADISPLRALTKLVELKCAGSQPGMGRLTDLSPLRGLSLHALTCRFNKIFDITPLKEAPLGGLNVRGCPVADISVLQGKPLTVLGIDGTRVTDLSPLKRMPLERLYLSNVPVSDLSPLSGLPLRLLWIGSSFVTDLSPLAKMPLEELEVESTPVTDFAPLRKLPLRRLTLKYHPGLDTELLRSVKTLEMINQRPAAEFCEIVDSINARAKLPLAFTTPGFDNWMKQVAALPARQQVEEVVKKLRELNPQFDGQVTPTIVNGFVTKFAFITDHVTDISPVRVFGKLVVLRCSKSKYEGVLGGLSNISPLRGMNLQYLYIDSTDVTDLSPLQGMQLLDFGCTRTNVVDLTPLRGMRLTYLSCEYTPVSDLTPLKEMKLEIIHLSGCPITDLSPLHGMPLNDVHCTRIKGADFSPLKDSPIKNLWLDFDRERDAEFLQLLRSIKTLETVNNRPVSEF